MASESDKLLAREEMARRLSSDTFLTTAINAAVRAAVRDHKQAGNPVAAWVEGRVVIVAPEDIQIPGDAAADAALISASLQVKA